MMLYQLQHVITLLCQECHYNSRCAASAADKLNSFVHSWSFAMMAKDLKILTMDSPNGSISTWPSLWNSSVYWNVLPVFEHVSPIVCFLFPGFPRIWRNNINQVKEQCNLHQHPMTFLGSVMCQIYWLVVQNEVFMPNKPPTNAVSVYSLAGLA